MKKEENYTMHEVNFMVQKKVKNALKKRKKKLVDELCAFEKIYVSDSKQDTFTVASAKKARFTK